MTDDQLIDRLADLCKRFGDTPLDGRYEVASRAHLSEQYLYQVLTGKPMANGNRRSIGKIAREKLTKAFPGWINLESSATPTEIAAAFTEGSSEKREALTLLARLPDTEAAAILPLIKSILTKYE